MGHSKHMIDNKWVAVRQRDAMQIEQKAQNAPKVIAEEPPPVATEPERSQEEMAEEYSTQYLQMAQQLGMMREQEMKACQQRQQVQQVQQAQQAQQMMQGMVDPNMMAMMGVNPMMAVMGVNPAMVPGGMVNQDASVAIEQKRSKSRERKK